MQTWRCHLLPESHPWLPELLGQYHNAFHEAAHLQAFSCTLLLVTSSPGQLYFIPLPMGSLGEACPHPYPERPSSDLPNKYFLLLIQRLILIVTWVIICTNIAWYFPTVENRGLSSLLTTVSSESGPFEQVVAESRIVRMFLPKSGGPPLCCEGQSGAAGQSQRPLCYVILIWPTTMIIVTDKFLNTWLNAQSIHPLHNSIMWVLLPTPFYRWKHWSIETLSSHG